MKKRMMQLLKILIMMIRHGNMSFLLEDINKSEDWIYYFLGKRLDAL